MLNDALAFLVRNLASFFILNLLLRFYLQVARAPFSHPLAQFTVKLTNFVVLPTRKLIPSVGGYDSATVLLAWLCALLMHVLLLLLLAPMPVNLLSSGATLGLVLLAALELFKLSFYLMFGAVLVQAVMSWVNPYNPLAPLLDRLTRPFLAPIRRLIPTIGGIDLSPLVLMLLLQMVLNFAVAPIESQLYTFVLVSR
ncbi:YggT family protein [Chitinimonas koreensis]|uniref:YggT family protein n=1 Tax=Chitinimonas koreensis TaxID=356302 RepID=UPI0003FA4A3D|nr:YggT family protein [Chitinimonas koreensis]QNM95959.1 YggT family protein [Chitinimonas koreensis]